MERSVPYLVHLARLRFFYENLGHQYHERLDTHGILMDRRGDMEYRDTMIYTMKKPAWRCLSIPASAKRERGKGLSFSDLYVIRYLQVPTSARRYPSAPVPLYYQ